MLILFGMLMNNKKIDTVVTIDGLGRRALQRGQRRRRRNAARRAARRPTPPSRCDFQRTARGRDSMLLPL